jgi:hypothetical protein
VLGLLVGNLVCLLMAMAGLFSFLTLENPVLYGGMALVAPLGFYSWPLRWVRVDYFDKQGNAQRAYFVPGSTIERWQGQTKQPCLLMEQYLR